jgi:two-component system, NtrC family, sensor kinase
VEVSEDFDENLAPALGDAQQLQQVFLNILNNAYDAVQEAGQRGRIAIRTHRRGDQIEVAITDNGTGVSDPERIFDPFFTTKHAAKGTGLGLSICYGIVRAHGGEILCFNNEEGPGCTFLVRVPVPTDAVTASIAKEAGR